MSKRLKFFPLFFCVICSIFVLSGCNQKPSEPVENDILSGNISDYLKEAISADIIVNDISTEVIPETDNMSYVANVKYTYGDLNYKRSYFMNYEYAKPFGYTLKEVSEKDKSDWKAEADKIGSDKIKADLEGEKYLSGYSDGIFEERRLIDIKILSQELDATYGYSRIKLTATLNADYVHEVLDIYCEYLLDDTNHFALTTKDISLENVEVQGKVSEDMIKDGLTSINFYHDEELSTWRIGEMNKLTYEIIEEKLDTEINEECIKLSFRGEGAYMYVTGIVDLTYHFSSGWYLYASSVEQETIETGMLIDSWYVDEELIVDHIVNDNPFNYDDVIVNFPIKENMIENMEITDRKITENGKLQTVYFKYDLKIEQTLFKISGYGKFDLGDGNLSVSLWSEIIESMTYDLSGTWTGRDIKNNYVAFYQLSLIDNHNGTLTGNLYVYGVDMKKNPQKIFEGELNVIGNVFSGNKFEILEKNWINGDISLGITLPVGYYLFTQDTLIVNNSISREMKLKRDDSSAMTYEKFSNIVEDGGLKAYIDNHK